MNIERGLSGTLGTHRWWPFTLGPEWMVSLWLYHKQKRDGGTLLSLIWVCGTEGQPWKLGARGLIQGISPQWDGAQCRAAKLKPKKEGVREKGKLRILEGLWSCPCLPRAHVPPEGSSPMTFCLMSLCCLAHGSQAKTSQLPVLQWWAQGLMPGPVMYYQETRRALLFPIPATNPTRCGKKKTCH